MLKLSLKRLDAMLFVAEDSCTNLKAAVPAGSVILVWDTGWYGIPAGGPDTAIHTGILPSFLDALLTTVCCVLISGYTMT